MSRIVKIGVISEIINMRDHDTAKNNRQGNFLALNFCEGFTEGVYSTGAITSNECNEILGILIKWRELAKKM